MWNPANNNDQTGQVAVRMETTPTLGSASISISQQQAPKKFAPMVAPKPKFNPYKQTGDPAHFDPTGNCSTFNTSTVSHSYQKYNFFILDFIRCSSVVFNSVYFMKVSG